MRSFGLAAALLCASIPAAASQPIAKVQLPCESASQMLSPTGAQLAVECKDKSVQLVDIPAGSARVVFPAGQSPNTTAYSPDGRWLAAGFTDGSVEVIATGDTASTRRWKAGSHRIDLLYFFPNGTDLFVGPVDSPGQVWELSQIPTQRATLPFDFGGIAAIAVSSDGKLLAAVGDDTVLRWYDTATWQKTRDYRGFLLETFALQFTPDGKQLLAGGADSRLTIFDVATGKQVRQMPAEAGSSIGVLDVLSNTRASAVYFDNAGGKPPHTLLWDLAAATSVPIKSDSQPTCAGAVRGKLWVCSVDGKTLTVAQFE